jgi:hypothetical protein
MAKTSFVTRALPWVFALWIAYIFVWYLQYKFTGADGSVWLFTVLTDWMGLNGYEKPMRIGVGSIELFAANLALYPRTQVVGGALATGIMTGAIFFHLASPLGIDPYEDGGKLFTEACLVWLAGLGIVWLRRREAIEIVRRLPVVNRYADALARFA